MPAGEYFVYYGFGLTNRHVFDLVDNSRYIDEKYLHCDYLEVVENFFSNKGFKGLRAL